ncbi:MAG: response regulator [Desulfobacterales bacterium]|nr:response regulator [Desulfobacterales bacterium]MDJ0855495.1 response regulator [Desulfobacterales bacterium]
MDNQNHVLVVDDEPTICSLMNVFLTQKGYQVRTANTGEDALTMFRESLPDIVLLDISMPGMRGIDVLRRMKEICGDCGVIMLSAYGDDETIQEAMDMGAYCYIQKPMELTELNAHLEALRQTLREKT